MKCFFHEEPLEKYGHVNLGKVKILTIFHTVSQSNERLYPVQYV